MKISLATQLVSRDGTLDRDAKMLNCFSEETPKGRRVIARQGLDYIGAYVTPTGKAQALFNANGGDFAIIDDGIYLCAPPPLSTGVFASMPSPDGCRKQVVSTLTGSGSGAPLFAFIKSLNSAWTYSGSGFPCNKVTSANYPTSTVPGVAFLDGTYYVMDPYGKIFGSALNDPTTWSSLNELQIDQGMGQPVAIARHLNYIVGFSIRGVQFFYDNANPPPGSPLSPVPNALSSTGCASAYSIQQHGDATIFMSLSNTAGASISMIEGLNIRSISTPEVDRVLRQNRPYAPGDESIYSMVVRLSGQAFYILTFANANITLACNLSNFEWAQWSSWDNVAQTDSAWDPGYAMNCEGNINSTTGPLTSAFLGRTTSKLYTLGLPGAHTTSYEPVHMLIRTRPMDAGSGDRKFHSELTLLADTVNVNIGVRYSNDDCQTWSVQRQINLNLPKKNITRLGSFFRRVYEFSCVLTNTVLRLDGTVIPDRDLPVQEQPSQE